MVSPQIYTQHISFFVLFICGFYLYLFYLAKNTDQPLNLLFSSSSLDQINFIDID